MYQIIMILYEKDFWMPSFSSVIYSSSGESDSSDTKTVINQQLEGFCSSATNPSVVDAKPENEPKITEDEEKENCLAETHKSTNYSTTKPQSSSTTNSLLVESESPLSPLSSSSSTSSLTMAVGSDVVMRRSNAGRKNPTHRMSFPLAQSQVTMADSHIMNGTSPASSSECVGKKFAVFMSFSCIFSKVVDTLSYNLEGLGSVTEAVSNQLLIPVHSCYH